MAEAAQTASMMLQADALPVPPPARGVPVSFAASLKSW